MYAYADQNFLISCANDPQWCQAVSKARRERSATMVLSPWHFYEFGNAKEAGRERLFAFAEEIEPAWILERVDIQVREFLKLWMEIWGGDPFPPFSAIGTLAEVAAALHGKHPNHATVHTLRDYVRMFTRDEIEGKLLPIMKSKRTTAEANRQDYKKGLFTPELRVHVEERYVRQQLELSTRLIVPREVRQQAATLLRKEPIRTKVEWFARWGCTKLLQTYQVELALTEDFYQRNAGLGVNRFVDRQHAVMALANCDVFVTDDGDLARRCEAIRAKLPFKVATVQKGAAFISML